MDISAGAAAAISALFSAEFRAAIMPGTLSTVTRVTARSISRKTYQATALAKAVKAAREKNARKSLALMPNLEICESLATAVLCRDGVLLTSIEDACSTVIWSTQAAPWARQ